MISRKLFGPPGTGKTTKLLKYVKTFLKLGTPVDKIGYFAFTKKAANEAIDRMLDAYPRFQRKDLKHFRTLHSLAFTQLGMKKAQVMQDEHYEQSYGLIDFTDMIQKFIVSGLCPKYDVAFIDEAQDLSPIQWKMFNIIKENSKYVILAGDDDQAIYGWAGADVKKFQQEISKKDIILPQSYRVPQLVQSLADKILKQIPDDRRVQKSWSARKEEGTVNYIYSTEDAPLDQGTWLVLARYNDKLNRLKPTLKERGIYFEFQDRKSYKITLFKTILNYTRWTKGDQLSLAEVRDIFEYTGTDTEITEERMYDLTEFGFDKGTPWYDVFQSDYEECLYIREMLSNGEELNKPPRIKLSTIHSAKGGEADNVLLMLDNTKTIRDSIEKSPDKQDEEHRVWYVGVTRTKQNLYVMSAKKEDQGYDVEGLI
jgi:DNA helicase-2/ATP-dependent DNA helicase PcrA